MPYAAKRRGGGIYSVGYNSGKFGANSAIINEVIAFQTSKNLQTVGFGLLFVFLSLSKSKPKHKNKRAASDDELPIDSLKYGPINTVPSQLTQACIPLLFRLKFDILFLEKIEIINSL